MRHYAISEAAPLASAGRRHLLWPLERWWWLGILEGGGWHSTGCFQICSVILGEHWGPGLWQIMSVLCSVIQSFGIWASCCSNRFCHLQLGEHWATSKEMRNLYLQTYSRQPTPLTRKGQRCPHHSLLCLSSTSTHRHAFATNKHVPGNRESHCRHFHSLF